MSRPKLDISYRKTFQGAWVLTAIVGTRLVSRQYMGYTKREATRLFREHVKKEAA